MDNRYSDSNTRDWNDSDWDSPTGDTGRMRSAADGGSQADHRWDVVGNYYDESARDAAPRDYYGNARQDTASYRNDAYSQDYAGGTSVYESRAQNAAGATSVYEGPVRNAAGTDAGYSTYPQNAAAAYYNARMQADAPHVSPDYDDAPRNNLDDYDEYFYGEGTDIKPRRHGCGCGCSTLITVLLVLSLVLTMWPTILPSSDIIRGLQIDQIRDWVTDTFGFEWPVPSEEEFLAIYNQENQGDANCLSDNPSTSLASTADAYGYYRGTLDEHAQSVYDAIETGVLAHDERISLPFGTEANELQTCWQFFLFDHPEVFWLPDDAHVTYWSWGGTIAYLEPDYKYDAETAESLSAQYEQLAQDTLLLGDTSAETMENICSYVADNTEYVDSDDDQSIDSVFSRGESVCAGYAKAVQYLALRHGIPCIYITGTADDFLGTGGRHAWLAAYVDGEICYYDPTWYDQRGFHATQYLAMNLVDISLDHTADYPSLLPR